MTNQKKIESNRKNTLKSAGPKTQEGKKVSRLNALKHGVLSQEILIPGEDKSVRNLISHLPTISANLSLPVFVESAFTKNSQPRNFSAKSHGSDTNVLSSANCVR